MDKGYYDAVAQSVKNFGIQEGGPTPSSPVSQLVDEVFNAIMSRFSPDEQNQFLMALRNKTVDYRKQAIENLSRQVKDAETAIDGLQKSISGLQ